MAGKRLVFGVMVTSFTGDPADLIYNWPHPNGPHILHVASSVQCCRQGRPPATVSLASPTRYHSLDVVAQAALYFCGIRICSLAGVLALWGALQPWNP